MYLVTTVYFFGFHIENKAITIADLPALIAEYQQKLKRKPFIDYFLLFDFLGWQRHKVRRISNS